MTEQLPTDEVLFDSGKAAAAEALVEIHGRSFSGRHPDLGKMIKCKVCRTRHRENELLCELKFVSVAGESPATQIDITVESKIPAKRIHQMLGSAAFKGKRKHPPLNKRTNEFVQIVRSFTPDEYTQQDLQKARTKARFILVDKYGRHGFMMPEWQSRKEADVRKAITKSEDLGSKETTQSSETEIPVS